MPYKADAPTPEEGASGLDKGDKIGRTYGKTNDVGQSILCTFITKKSSKPLVRFQ